jgi:tRNA A-37 threonylcarbamoyl transferase component Bud32
MPLSWSDLDINEVKSALLQTIAAYITAFSKLGFVHCDLHCNNVLLRKTKKTQVTYGDGHIQLQTYGILAFVNDFEHSKLGEKDHEQIIWDVDDLINSVRSLLRSEISGFQHITGVLEPYKENTHADMTKIWSELVAAIGLLNKKQ